MLRPAWDRNESAAWAEPLRARRKGRRLLRALGDGEPGFTLQPRDTAGRPGKEQPVGKERDWRVALWVSENL